MSVPPEQLASAYDYNLPAGLIAQQPASPRDSSRLLVLNDKHIEHRRFTDFPNLLRAGDLLVLNETRVIAARLYAARVPSGGRVEIVLLRPADGLRYDRSSHRWLALVKPGRRVREGQELSFGELGSATVSAVHAGGVRELTFTLAVDFETFLSRAGRLPLPPYVRRDSGAAQTGYQTIFAREPGSVAAPTASLHFTKHIFSALAERGVEIAKLVLDIGLGTFRPLQEEALERHVMHSETFSIPAETAAAVARARAEGRRIIAAGTTVLRALEAAARPGGTVVEGLHETDLFIRPGFRFRIADALLTNFHLPRSTLLVLVCAFAGRDRIFAAYREAIDRGYRFFSFGDAMLMESRGATTIERASR